MIKLLIALCVLASDKLADQQSVVPQIVTIQTLPILSPISRDYNRRFTGPPSSQRFQAAAELPNQFLNNNGSDLPSFSAARENQPRRQLFIPRVVSERMSGNRPLVRESVTRRTSGDIDARDTNVTTISDDVYDNVNFNVDKKEIAESVQTTTAPIKPPILPAQQNGTTVKVPQLASDSQLNITGVTFDQRASFDGDKCPSGLIRINGSNECIRPD